jgi:hypothetical protein
MMIGGDFIKTALPPHGKSVYRALLRARRKNHITTPRRVQAGFGWSSLSHPYLSGKTRDKS